MFLAFLGTDKCFKIKLAFFVLLLNVAVQKVKKLLDTECSLTITSEIIQLYYIHYCGQHERSDRHLKDSI